MEAMAGDGAHCRPGAACDSAGCAGKAEPHRGGAMSTKRTLIGLLAVAWLPMLTGACGAPGLPPAGPAPDEVDVGYGTQPKEDVTGAVTSVSADAMGGARSTNVEELLRGRVAGLQIIPRPEGGYFYRIRGLATSQHEQPEPLFVV